MSNSGTAVLAKEDDGFVYDAAQALAPEFVVPDAVMKTWDAKEEGWLASDPVDELLSQLKTLGRHAEARCIEVTLRDFDSLRDGPVILGAAASSRFDEIMASPSRELPDPAPSLDAFAAE